MSKAAALRRVFRNVVLASCAVPWAGGPAVAQIRLLPLDAPVGHLTINDLTTATIDSKQYRLSPGARIYSKVNTTLVPGVLPPNLLVRYQLDATGQISIVWILNDAEQAAASQ
jgi:hypothetical protein